MELVTASVVFASAVGVGEGVVCIVYLLELLRAGLAFGRVGCYAVGVVAEGLSIANLADHSYTNIGLAHFL